MKKLALLHLLQISVTTMTSTMTDNQFILFIVHIALT
jgi:hypothetical protein